MASRKRAHQTKIKPINVAELRRECDPNSLGFSSTDELEPIKTIIGQDRALGAIRFGSEMDRPGYNLFVLGAKGTGRHAAIMSYLSKKAVREPAPDDWVYVYNFDTSHRPLAMRLPPGIAVGFRDAMAELVDDLRSAIPALFQSDEYREKRRKIDAEFEEAQEQSFEDLRQKAEAQNIGIMRTPMGFALAPLRDGKVIKPEVYNVMAKKQRSVIENKISELQDELKDVLEMLPKLEKSHRDQIRSLNAELSGTVVDASIGIVTSRFKGVAAIQGRMKAVRKDMVDHTELFLEQPEAEENAAFPRSREANAFDPKFNRYLVNVMVTNDRDGNKKGAPLIIEDHPTLAKVVGRIEHISQFGALLTDFTMIRPGALHQANGGYLVLDARKILSEMLVWEALKRTLHSKTISIVSVAEELSLASTISLDPEPIPLKVKVVLVGSRMLFYLLSTLDPDFSNLFKVEVDFDEEIERSTENIALYARLISTIAAQEKLRPFKAEAVARVIEETARLAEDAERLSLNVGELTDLLCEVDFWAGKARRKCAVAKDVERAITEKIYRADRIRQRSYDLINRGTILIETDGKAVGQINGLSVLSLGKYRFGQPSKITVRVRMGSGKVIDIERETKLGGALHSKGVLILSSYLAANYARDVPMSLWASIVFEQSYGGVDGDSASSAELYALLSALANVPILQSFAVTGSVNQHGLVQAIGGVNEKIEGFYDICKARGLAGHQGVLIPQSNVKHLMLRSDVVKAAARGKFTIYSVSTIYEGIELLTGIPAGSRGEDGRFPADSINGLVEARLEHFARKRKSFSSDDRDKSTKEMPGEGE